MEAPDPTAAARKAWAIQHKPDSTVNFFEVVEHDGSHPPPNWDLAVEVDLMETE
ncbi:MAG TPA: hypothetical protein VLW53_04605 [Candidatus Eisenbacteria bacterium]|nr:hypothetical protein [Candidatus Eisenbacteria bacterium]